MILDKVSCIIPAYNEGERIKAVLDILLNNHLIDEIIVVNDGSKDNTKEVVKELVKKFDNISLLNNPKNMGKSYSIVRGIEASKNPFLMFIDADLIGLRREDINHLLMPVLNNEVDVTISLRKNTPFINKILKLDFVSGERVLRKDILEDYRELLKLPGFGLEPYINKKIIKNKLRVRIVAFSDVISPYPYEKWGRVEGMKRFVSFVKQVVSVIGIHGVLYQIMLLKILSRN